MSKRQADERLYADEAAQRAGLSRSTWTAYASRGLPLNNPVPPPDDHEIDRHYRRPWWYASTVDAWIARRPGKGRGARPSRRKRA